VRVAEIVSEGEDFIPPRYVRFSKEYPRIRFLLSTFSLHHKGYDAGE